MNTTCQNNVSRTSFSYIGLAPYQNEVTRPSQELIRKNSLPLGVGTARRGGQKMRRKLTTLGLNHNS